jgi:hypothetical protein
MNPVHMPYFFRTSFNITLVFGNRVLRRIFGPNRDEVTVPHRTPLIWRLRVPDQGSTVGGLLSVSLPEEHRERRKFCRRGDNPRTCDSGSAIAS